MAASGEAAPSRWLTKYTCSLEVSIGVLEEGSHEFQQLGASPMLGTFCCRNATKGLPVLTHLLSG